MFARTSSEDAKLRNPDAVCLIVFGTLGVAGGPVRGGRIEMRVLLDKAFYFLNLKRFRCVVLSVSDPLAPHCQQTRMTPVGGSRVASQCPTVLATCLRDRVGLQKIGFPAEWLEEMGKDTRHTLEMRLSASSRSR